MQHLSSKPYWRDSEGNTLESPGFSLGEDVKSTEGNELALGNMRSCAKMRDVAYMHSRVEVYPPGDRGYGNLRFRM
jgi:hypothetical protein